MILLDVQAGVSFGIFIIIFTTIVYCLNEYNNYKIYKYYHPDTTYKEYSKLNEDDGPFFF